MLKNKQTYLLLSRNLIYFFIICFMIFTGCGDREDSAANQDDIIQVPETPIILTADASTITIGTLQNISFKAEGGTGPGLFIWDINFSNSIDGDKFEFSSFGTQAVLSYNGGAVNSKTIIILVEDGYGNFANQIISINNPENTLSLESDSDTFSIGISKTIAFKASGGTGGYIWGISYSTDILTESFTFSSGGDSGILMYDGKDSVSGIINISIKDKIGRKSEKLIIVSGINIEAFLEIQPETVGIGGETLCIFSLTDIENNAPVPGRNISFQIEHGPAFFIDAASNDIGVSSIAATGSDGKAYARIKAGETKENTNIIVSAASDTGETATLTFSIDRNHDIIEFSGDTHIEWNHKGYLSKGKKSWVLNLQLKYTDKDGNPLYNKEILLDTYLQTNNIDSDIYLGEQSLPASIITDDDGISDFVLKVTLSYDNIDEGTNLKIGSLVLSGVGEHNTKGSVAIEFNVTTTSSPLLIAPSSVENVGSGQIVGFNAQGGVPPYTWSVTGRGNLDTTGSKSAVYTAPTPAEFAVVTLKDSGGNSITANISPKEIDDEVIEALTITPVSGDVGDRQIIGFNAQGGVPPYTWSVTGKGNLDITGSKSAVYTAPTPAEFAVVTLKDSGGNSITANISPKEIDDEIIEALTITPVSGDVGDGQIVGFNAQGGVPPYTWSVTGKGNLDITGSKSAVYTAPTPAEFAVVTLKDSGGNSITANISPKEIDDEIEALTITPVSGDVGDGQTIGFNAQGGVPPYTWSVTGKGNLDITGSKSAVYTAPTPAEFAVVTLKDSGGNSITANISPKEIDDEIIDDLTIIPVSGDVGDGQIIGFNAQGGVPPYTWSVTGKGNLDITGSKSAVYTAPTPAEFAVVTLKDSGGNSITANISPKEIDDEVIEALTITPVSGDVGDRQIIGFNAQGGVPPYTWSVTGKGNLNITGSKSAVYTAPTPAEFAVVTLKDSGGNSITANISPKEIDDEIIEALTITPVSGDVGDGQIIGFNAQGGVPPYTWSVTGKGNLDITGSKSAVYTAPTPAEFAVVTLKDSGGNSITANISPKEIDDEIEALTITPVSGDVGDGQTIGFNAQGGVPPYTWSVTGKGNLDITGSKSAVYTAPTPAEFAVVTLKDSADNSITANISPKEIDDEIIEALTIAPASGDVIDSQIIGFNAQGGVPPYTWSVTGKGNLDITGSKSAVYTAPTPAEFAVVTLKDSGGNSITANISPKEIDDGTVKALTITPVSGDVSDGQIIGFNAQGGVPPYEWYVNDKKQEGSTGSNTFLYTAPNPAIFAVVTLVDAEKNSVIVNISPKDKGNALLISPESYVLIDGQIIGFNAQGGVPPYEWYVNDKKQEGSTGSNTFLYTAPNPAIFAVVTLVDYSGNSVSANIFPKDEALSITPISETVSAKQIIGFNAQGGTPPYEWYVNNKKKTDSLIGNNTFLYTVPATAEFAVITVVDADNNSVTAMITPKIQ
ncbi:Uncharacterized protein dnl_61620 [Desulfonema limicola]|uniref:Uncharacterized protein n=1 Tax=Desulfonema limicola TaxID=45656 RepID=A0A975BE65_9BACT|nr:hypothetical protein [Desulfonema limicola]QTA83747.1 Uncharacterized protein dnl_61620 [Desulfonema limicola]